MAAAMSSPAKAARWRRIAGIDEIGLGQGRCFLIGERKVALFRLRNGLVRALDALCPHKAGPLADGMLGSDTVICPFHGYKFSLLDGGGLDNHFAIVSYSIQVQDNDIYINLHGADSPDDGVKK